MFAAFSGSSWNSVGRKRAPQYTPKQPVKDHKRFFQDFNVLSLCYYLRGKSQEKQRRCGKIGSMEYIDLRKVRRGGLKEIRKQVVRLKKMGKTGKEIEELTGVRQNRAREQNPTGV